MPYFVNRQSSVDIRFLRVSIGLTPDTLRSLPRVVRENPIMAELRLYRVGWQQIHRWVPSAIVPALQIGAGTGGGCWIFSQVGA
jgi:hypothetical protein